MADEYTDDSDYRNHAIVPVAAGRGQLALQRFQEQQARLPLQDALKIAQLQKEQAALEFQGRAQLDEERTQTNTLRQGAAFYAAKPVLEKYLRDQVAAGHPEFSEGGSAHAEAYANFASQFPYALRYLPDVAKTVQEHAEVHDLKAKMEQAIKAMPGGQRLSGVTLGTNQEVGIQTHPSETPPDQKIIQAYSSIQAKLAGAKALKSAEMARQIKASPGTGYNPLDTTGAPNSAASIEAQIKANQMASDILKQHFPSLSGVSQATRQTATTAPAATPAATPVPAATPSVPAATTIPENSQGIPQPQPAATPKHLGVYNPATGEFE